MGRERTMYSVREEGNQRLGRADAHVPVTRVASSSYRVHFVDEDLAGRRGTHARLVGRNSGRGRNSGNWCQKVELICPDKQRSLPSVCISDG